MSTIVEFDELSKIAKSTQVAAVKKCLNRQGIVTFNGVGNTIWTTTGLIEAAGGLTQANKQDEPADKHF